MQNKNGRAPLARPWLSGSSNLLLGAGLGALCLPLWAAEVSNGITTIKPQLGEATSLDVGAANLSVRGWLGLGTVIRAANPDPVLVKGASMNTLNDGDQNYRAGDAVSSAIESYVQADLQYQGLGLRLAGKAWYDYTQAQQSVLHGNVSNHYQSGAPLSDEGFVPLGRFGNVVLDDAYVYGTTALAGYPLQLRAGRQTIPWGSPTAGGMLSQVNATDYAALSRASSVAAETGIPDWAVYGKLNLSERLTLDAFYQFAFAPNVYPGCGTFYSTGDYVQPGCNQLTLNGALLSAIAHRSISTSDAQSVSNALDYVSRAPDRLPSGGQYGAGLQYLLNGVGRFGFYAANIDSKVGYTGVQHNTAGVLTPLLANTGQAQATGLSSQYYRSYPANLHLFVLNFASRLPDQTGLYAELGYIPDQPLAWNGADFLNGLLLGRGPLARLYKLPAGASADGYDRYQVMNLSLGGERPLGKWAGGDFKLAAELGFKHVFSLPDPAVMRYGRAGWGMAASQAYATCSGDAATCRLDGFITSNAWGARLRLEARYATGWPDITLTPALTLGQDVRGYSYDGQYSQGRFTTMFSLALNVRRDYQLDLSYLKTGGGDYNVLRDRSLVSLGLGMRL
ncbi:DUF1302 domain-containing protein [Aquitalea sp. USM4]|uniref:DUF1302 domain-containing protein n=1 Tax=Aquitalea sp. USM4 TaxID=1590041 RepID=UPI00103C1E30|nr:DUF1302 family protein [Aquitalea sp. USM4]QBJ78945.1 DUF1302 domain-containing protein [Aquitalea sp. USM4]